MGKQILITGGAGFIGSHTCNELLRHGHRVRVLDNLTAQVHGAEQSRPDYLSPEVELVYGDIRDITTVRKALRAVDSVFHFAAAVGVGQSMYQIAHYIDTNSLGTATLLQVLIDQPVERLIVASSMSIYGEGLYRKSDGTIVENGERSIDHLRDGTWELTDRDGDQLEPIPTPETKTPHLSSVYALSKYDQERLCLLVCRSYGIPAVALRFFNAYGPYQALSNPYTGVLAIFASRLLNGSRPLIFEDGLQKRDFVSVYDIARACRLALEAPAAVGEVFNIGSGQPVTIQDLARKAAAAVGRDGIEPEVTGQYRAGDIRHCFADLTKARLLLGYSPEVALSDGLVELASWLEGQHASDYVDQARQELVARGLAV